jgi:drug/metabolite transporter (DMT)-like permease
MYSVALVASTAAAALSGDLRQGLVWMTQPGTYDELALPLDQRTWSVPGKWCCLVGFSSVGFFGSTCSAAITKHFGALTMSITTTARKATTLFLSFFFFGNVCTAEHLVGIVIFIGALTAKALRTSTGDGTMHRRRKHRAFRQLELGIGTSKDASTAPAPQARR